MYYAVKLAANRLMNRWFVEFSVLILSYEVCLEGFMFDGKGKLIKYVV